MKNAIIWNVAKFAALLNGLKAEATKTARIGYSHAWTADAGQVETETATHTARVICSYNSAMGLVIENNITGIQTVIFTDENHGITTATAKQFAIYAHDAFGARFNLYATGKPFAESMGGFDISRTPRASDYVGLDKKQARALRGTGYAAFFEVYADILDNLNDRLHDWNKVTD